MGFLFVPIFIVYLLVAIISISVAVKFGRSNVVVFVVVLFFVIFPFRRLIFYNILFFYYSMSPLQEIHETVESPVSVYWEDNVWPGFDTFCRQWMVKNYLDGKHLQLLALNGDDGKIHLYRASQETFSKSKALYPEYIKVKEGIEAAKKEAISVGSRGGDNKAMWKRIREREDAFRKNLSNQYEEQREKEIAEILDRVEVFADRSNLPSIRYRVEFNLLPKSFLLNNQNKILHADRISIVDTDSEKEIAFSVRYMAYSWTRYFGAPLAFGYYKLGDERAYEFDDRVLFEFSKETRKGSECHSSLFHRNKNLER